MARAGLQRTKSTGQRPKGQHRGVSVRGTSAPMRSPPRSTVVTITARGTTRTHPMICIERLRAVASACATRSNVTQASRFALVAVRPQRRIAEFAGTNCYNSPLRGIGGNQLRRTHPHSSTVGASRVGQQAGNWIRVRRCGFLAPSWQCPGMVAQGATSVWTRDRIFFTTSLLIADKE